MLHRYSKPFLELLQSSGWRPGRTVETDHWFDKLAMRAFERSPQAEALLSEFGGLKIEDSFNYDAGHGPRESKRLFWIEPLLGAEVMELIQRFEQEHGLKLFPVGEVDYLATVCIDPSGALFGVTDVNIRVIALDWQSGLELIFDRHHKWQLLVDTSDQRRRTRSI